MPTTNIKFVSAIICGVWKHYILKGSIFLKNRHFIVQERFNKLIYGVNTIIKCGIWQPVKIQLVSCLWSGSKMKRIFFRISELMLPTLIQRYDKKSFHFDPVQGPETNWNFTGCQMQHFMIVLPVPEMSAKKVIFRMENCGHLPAEVCGVLGRFVRKSTQAGNYFCADVRNISICRSAERSADVCGHLRTSLRTSMRTSAWIGADVLMDWCGRPHGLVRTSAWIGADVRIDGCWCLRKSAWMGADIRRARGSVRVAPPAV